MSTNVPLVEFTAVSKRYNTTGSEGLKSVSFSLERNEMAFLTGHSGAGKTTLLRLIAGLEQPTHGKILLNGHDITKLSRRRLPEIRRQMGLIFQTPYLISEYTVFENVAVPLLIAGLSESDIKKRVRAALSKVNLSKKERCYPATLSSGEQQRVSIARAVVNKPVILLADEPTGNLDPELSTEIMKLFEEFHRVGVSIFIASHDLSLITKLNHRILTLHQGIMVSTGETLLETTQAE